MFGADNEYLIDSSEDDPSVKVCPGWTTAEWAKRLRYMAKIGVNKELNAERLRHAKVLERRLKRMNDALNREI